MANYRGGDIQQSTYNAELVKAIREGRTEGQRRRDLIKQIGGAAAQVGLVGARAAYAQREKENAEEADDAENRAIMVAAIRNSKKASDLNMSNAAAAKAANPAQAPMHVAMQRMGGEGLGDINRNDPYADQAAKEPFHKAVQNIADEQLNNIAINGAAAKAPIRNTWGSGPAFTEAHNNASVLGDDINTSRQLMKNSSAGMNPYGEDRPYDERDEL